MKGQRHSFRCQDQIHLKHEQSQVLWLPWAKWDSATPPEVLCGPASCRGRGAVHRWQRFISVLSSPTQDGHYSKKHLRNAYFTGEDKVIERLMQKVEFTFYHSNIDCGMLMSCVRFPRCRPWDESSYPGDLLGKCSQRDQKTVVKQERKRKESKKQSCNFRKCSASESSHSLAVEHKLYLKFISTWGKGTELLYSHPLAMGVSRWI